MVMGLLDEIKKQSQEKGMEISNNPQEIKLEQLLNRAFYLEKNIDEEVRFLRQVMTRGLESQERIGLHASSLIVGDKVFCVRQQVLSLLYRQSQGENEPIGLKRIFEEGNAIHEKWQRIFIRAGYSKVEELDYTQMNKEFQVSFTPDIICTIPEIYDGKMIGEIKSMNTFSFKKQEHHPSGRKQCQLYMYLTGIKKGFVLMDDKNTQDFKIRLYDFDYKEVEVAIERMKAIKHYKERVLNEGRLVCKCSECMNEGIDCKRAKQCPMAKACFKISKERIF